MIEWDVTKTSSSSVYYILADNQKTCLEIVSHTKIETTVKKTIG